MFGTPGVHNRQGSASCGLWWEYVQLYGRALNESSWVNRGKKDAYNLEGLTLHQVKPIEREAVIKQERGRLSHAGGARCVCVLGHILTVSNRGP